MDVDTSLVDEIGHTVTCHRCSALIAITRVVINAVAAGYTY